jgi:predicted transcriptional regulator
MLRWPDIEGALVRREDPLETLLGPLEQDVMDVIWQVGDATVRDVHDVLAGRRKIAYTTVMTTMTRLAAKGLLVRDTSGLAHRYRAVVSREAYARSTMSSVLSWLLDRYPEPSAAYLAEVIDDADAVTLETLRDAVERRRSEEA